MQITLRKKVITSSGEILHTVNVPCGKCENCIKRRRMEWSFRLEEEMKHSKTCYFVTITYDNENVPYDKWGNKILIATTLESKKNYLETLRKPIPKDKILKKLKLTGWFKNDKGGWYKYKKWEDNSLQGFMKRLRHYENGNTITWEKLYNGLNKNDKIKFYGVGEYGSQKLRPHMHVIIYNASKKNIEKAWKMGDIQVLKATPETMAYCTKYLDKWKDKKQDWRKPPEFNEQSKNLGIGWLENEKVINFYKRNLDINYLVNKKGIKIPMPRYYRYKMLTEDEIQTQIGLIHNAVKEEERIQIEKYGEEAYIRAKKSKQDVNKLKFKKSQGRRDLEK